MNRREFIQLGLLAGGCAVCTGPLQVFSRFVPAQNKSFTWSLAPDSRPFVRWWWNGNKVQKEEIRRELDLLKAAGIGGVEINPISFPSLADDKGIASLTYLSNEWIDALKIALEHARQIGMTCDLLVGSGWPFGAETLPLEERAQVVLVYALPVEGPNALELTMSSIFEATDPQVTEPNALRTAHILSLDLVPDPMEGLDQVHSLSYLLTDPLAESVRLIFPDGKYCLYALVQVDSFASVINGAPGAAGSILDHLSKDAVVRYLENVSQKIESRIGPLKQWIRALFCDSMELEGCNWCRDFASEFQQRNGYDLMPYLPFILFKVGRLGGVLDEKYGAEKTPAFEEELARVRFDFEFTKASLLKERFTEPFVAWCHRLGVQARAQAYGRGFFPLESSLLFDLPEGESWTTNWLRHKPGEEMSDDDYRRGRAYTMIDKYVSSAAHLSGRKVISCEEMTNTYRVFNASLQLLKIGSDQSMMAGITHSVWHGFNYSPPQADFPGWIQYGSYYNEHNTWWPFFHLLNEYKARIYSVLQQSVMLADIAILPPNYDLWAWHGVQTDPFPELLNVPYTSLLWEAISQNGGASDYITESVLEQMQVQKGRLCYKSRSYSVLFLPGLQSIQPHNLEKIVEFAFSGGKVFCIGTQPEKAPGLAMHELRDAQVASLMEKLRSCNHFFFEPVPQQNRYMEWYGALAIRYALPHAVAIEHPSRFLMQVHYMSPKGEDVFLIHNAHRYLSQETRLVFHVEGHPWIWDPETGKRYCLPKSKDGVYSFEMGPARLIMVVFEKKKGLPMWHPLPSRGTAVVDISQNWELSLQHAFDPSLSCGTLLSKLEAIELLHPEFAGTAVYRKEVLLDGKDNVLNLGRVEGVSRVLLDGRELGTQWYGQRIFSLDAFSAGRHRLEVQVVTTMGNYLKTLKENKVAQYWVNRPKREQDIEPLGLFGPVTIYKN